MGIGNIGWSEFIVILAIALIFFGPRRLPGIAQAIGKSLREFQKALNEVKSEIAQANRETDARTGSRPSRDPLNLLSGVSDIVDRLGETKSEADVGPRPGPDPEPSRAASGMAAEVEHTSAPRAPGGAGEPPPEAGPTEKETSAKDDEDDRGQDAR